MSVVVFPKAKEGEVVMLILGGINVATSLVLSMFLQRLVFRKCGKSYALVGPKSSKQLESLCECDIVRFLCFLRVRDLDKCEETMKIHDSFIDFP